MNKRHCVQICRGRGKPAAVCFLDIVQKEPELLGRKLVIITGIVYTAYIDPVLLLFRVIRCRIQWGDCAGNNRAIGQIDG